MKYLVGLAVAGTMALGGLGCGEPFGDDTRCRDIIEKLYDCDPEVAFAFTCTEQALESHDAILAMDCSPMHAKADGMGGSLYETKDARIHEKGYLNLQDLEDLFLSTGKWYSFSEDHFFSYLMSDLITGSLDYRHEPLKDYIFIEGLFGTRQIAVPQPDDKPLGHPAKTTDRQLGNQLVQRMATLNPPGPRW